VIAEIPAVVEVAVIGVSHELLGEAIRAFVVAAPGAVIGADEVVDHCRRRLALFKCLESVEFLSTLPHKSSGKVVKPKLKEIALKGCA
jgi:long-chain acyl-CoA synthetase